MALPHLYTARRRQIQDDRHQNWVRHAEKLQNAHVSVNKHCSWESPSSFNASMDAWARKQENETKETKLQFRRTQLAKLLANESEMYQRELRDYSGKRLPLHLMKEKAEALKSAREEKRREVVEQKLYDHWKENNPELREIESARLSEHVIDTWRDQIEEHEILKEEENRIDAEEELERKIQVKEAMKLAREEELRKKLRNEEIASALKYQMEELREREQEAQKIKFEEEELMKERLNVEVLKEQRLETERQRKKAEIGRILKRQHAAALKRKSREVQRQLEEDRNFMEILARQEQERFQQQRDKQDKARADAKWMQEVLEKQLQEEREREAALNLLYQEEAEKQWAQRERQWELERLAREKLMKEVLEGRGRQIEERIEAVKEKQMNSLREREILLEDLDELNHLKISEENERKERVQTTRREIENQVEEKRALSRMADDEMERELQQSRLAEKAYSELLDQEAQQLKNTPFTPRYHARVKQAWN